MPFTYDKRFLLARKLLRLGECPEYEDLKFIYEQGLETHLGPSEKELAEKCRIDFGLSEQGEQESWQ